MSDTKEQTEKAPESESSESRIYGKADPLFTGPNELADDLTEEPEFYDSPQADDPDPITMESDPDPDPAQFEGMDLEASTLMLILDTALAMGCGAIDRTGDYERYTLKEKRREELAKHLGKVMEKWETQFSSETLFMGLLLVSYTPLYLLAFKRRKENAPADATQTAE